MANILRINLSTLTATIEEVSEPYAKFGGRGLTSCIIDKEVPPTCDPLGAENKLVFAAGILGGTTAPCSGRLSVGAKSPMTQGIKEANVGGAMAQKLAKKGVHWMDVPVSGAANQARLGNMVFMVGGKKTVFNKVKPVLDQVGKKTVHAGKNGDAAMLKLVVNLVLFLNQAAAIEGMTMALKAGLDTDVLWDTLVSGAAGSDVINARGQDMLAGDFKAKGALWIGIKDLDLALDAGKELGVMLPVGGLYRQFMLHAFQRGWGQEDCTVVLRIYEELAGIKRKAKKA